MLPLGTAAPNFDLPDTDGRRVRLADFKASKALLVMFICNHCPFVKHVAAELAKLGKEYQAKGVGVVAIMSNDIAKYPDDGPEKMKQEKQAQGYPFPYVLDEDQAVARAYHAACTPDYFVFDAGHKLAYRGQLDDSRPNSGTPVTGKDLRAALDAVLAGHKPAEKQMPSMGCNIKWKPGQAPAYFNK
jgi:peroxiredoxin